MTSAAQPARAERSGPRLRVLTIAQVARSRLKRSLDVLGAVFFGLIALPIWILAAVAIRLDSPGRILFRQTRIGLQGESFTILKFRSMYEDSDEATHREYVTGLVNGENEAANGGVYKLVDDDRVTRVGRWLRRTSLDELPQLINVLRGEMSLIGPRPPLPYEVEHYDAEQMRRLEARPGLTGLWQVSGRNQVSYRSMVRLDLEYIDRWTPWLDVKILLKTLPVVLRNTGRAH